MQKYLTQMDTTAKVSRVIILPGNGCDDVRDANWYHSVEKDLQARISKREWGESIKVVLEDMPDPYVARRDVWLPFIHKELGCDENTILIGHSSGAEAIMR
jgi:predicted alpha/beta hydrolase family esterase